MTSRMFTQSLRSQLTRAGITLGSGSRAWIAPTLLTAGLIAHSNRKSLQWSQESYLFSNGFTSITEPLFHANVANMEKPLQSENDDNVHDNETHQDTEGQQSLEGESPPTNDTSTKQETPKKTDDEANDDSRISCVETVERNVIGGESEKQQEDSAVANDNVSPNPTEIDDENDNDDDKDGEEEEEEEEEDDDDDDDDDDEPSPPAPLYEPVKGTPDELKKEDLWDNFTIKAVRMTDDEFDDEGKLSY